MMRYNKDMETKDPVEVNQIAKTLLDQIELDHVYTYEILQPRHVDRVVNMFSQDFCDCEPMTHYLNMPYEPYLPFARAVTEKAAQVGLSVVALNGEHIVACALVEDFTDPLEMNFPVYGTLKPIFALLDELSGDFFKNRKIPARTLAHLFITAVDERYHHRGLSKQVNFRAMALAVSRGYSLMVSELTNVYNEWGIVHHLPFAKWEVGRILYKDFVYEDKHIFANLEGSAATYLWELRPGFSL